MLYQVTVPTIDVQNYLNQRGSWQVDCKNVAESFRKYGLVIVKDPRVNAQKNYRFLTLMERYFEKRQRQFEQGNKTLDVADWNPVPKGIMHEGSQIFQSFQQDKQKLQDPHKCLTPLVPVRDPRWRFHWLCDYNNNVVPSDFADFQQIMDDFSQNMKKVSLTVSEMIARGFGIQLDYLSKHIVNGQKYLSPTAANLNKIKFGEVITGFHRDFDILTIHGKARFPGLFAWLNTGQKFLVKVPEDCLLLQAGKQLEWIMGGQIRAGFHQVVFSQQTQKAVQIARKKGESLWRISSTMFNQAQGEMIMQPHNSLATAENKKLYPPKKAQDYLDQELNRLISN